MDIARRINACGCCRNCLTDRGEIDCLAGESLLDRGQPDRCRTDSDRGDMGLNRTALIEIVEQRYTCECEVPTTSRKFINAQRRPSFQGGNRTETINSSGASAVVRLARKNSLAMMVRGPFEPTTSISASQATAIPEIQQRGRHAQGCHRPFHDCGFGNAPRAWSLPPTEGGHAELCVPLDIAPAHKGAERHAAIIDADAPKRFDWTYVHQQLGCRHTEGKHRHQALPARYNFGLIAMRGEKTNCFFDPARAYIVKRRRLHDSADPN